MTIDLIKRSVQQFNLDNPALRRLAVRFRWESLATTIDCDFSAVMLTADYALLGPEFVVFYNNLVSGDGAIRHLGDQREAIGGHVGEVIQCNLDVVSSDVSWILLVVTIHGAAERNEVLANLKSTSITLHAPLDGPILHAHAVPASAASGDSCIVARISPTADGHWVYEAVAEPFVGGLDAIYRMYFKG